MPRIFWIWTTSSHKLQLVQVHWIWNSDIVELWISQQGGNSLFFTPTTMNSGLLPLSTNGDLPLSMNGWHPPSLNEQPGSSLSPPSLDKRPCPPSLNEWLSSILFQWTASFHLWQWPPPSLVWWAPLPRWTASPLLRQVASPSLDKQFLLLADGLTTPPTNFLPLPSVNSLLPASMDSLIPQQMLSSSVSDGLAMSKYCCHSWGYRIHSIILYLGSRPTTCIL